MKTSDTTFTAVCTLRAEQEQLVWTAYVKSLQTLEKASTDLQWARNDLEETTRNLQRRRRAGATETQLRALQQQIQELKQRRRAAEVEATIARRHADQALVSVLSARRARAVLAKYSDARKSQPHEELVLAPMAY